MEGGDATLMLSLLLLLVVVMLLEGEAASSSPTSIFMRVYGRISSQQVMLVRLR